MTEKMFTGTLRIIQPTNQPLAETNGATMVASFIEFGQEIKSTGANEFLKAISCVVNHN